MRTLFFTSLCTMICLHMAAAQDGVNPDQAERSSEKNPVVVLHTSKGVVEVELFRDKAPVTVRNFLEYVEAGFYDGTIFHRVIPGFMIQAGGYTPDMKPKKTRAPIRNEADNGLQNKRGTLAMARTPAVHSATAQFFINLVDNDYLNHTPDNFGYAVFGKVTGGMDVVDGIAGVPTGRKAGHTNVPHTPVLIQSAEVKKSIGEGD